MTNTKTYAPNELAATLGVSGKTLRGFLRKSFPRVAEAKGTTWVVTEEAAESCRAHFKRNVSGSAETSA
jgi:predicted site-specific integrase-resolvase